MSTECNFSAIKHIPFGYRQSPNAMTFKARYSKEKVSKLKSEIPKMFHEHLCTVSTKTHVFLVVIMPAHSAIWDALAIATEKVRSFKPNQQLGMKF